MIAVLGPDNQREEPLDGHGPRTIVGRNTTTELLKKKIYGKEREKKEKKKKKRSGETAAAPAGEEREEGDDPPGDEMWRRRVGALLLQSRLAPSSTAASSCQRFRHHLLPSVEVKLPPAPRAFRRAPRAHLSPSFPTVHTYGLRICVVLPGTSCSQSSCQALHFTGCKFVCSRVPITEKLALTPTAAAEEAPAPRVSNGFTGGISSVLSSGKWWWRHPEALYCFCLRYKIFPFSFSIRWSIYSDHYFTSLFPQSYRA